ncbi:MAG TPA: copper chaperone PCu(A)C [Caulobacteraceae bacterium]|nr:copper chaperone PCu(A)C [Caulobacteraceae bacterium]
MKRSWVAAAAMLMVSSVALAANHAGSITLSDAAVSPSRGTLTTSTGRLTITNNGGADKLMSASCSCAAKVELHRMWMDGQVMRMREIKDGLAVPAHGKLVLGGDEHLMLIGVKPLLKLGAHVKLTLKFQHAGAISVDAPVGEPAPMRMKMPHH